MILTPKTAKYLQHYGIRSKRPLRTASRDGVRKVVVIPALAESSSLLSTLVSLAKNPPDELVDTLVLCVINNHRPPLAAPEEIRDNQNTLALLEQLLQPNDPPQAPSAGMPDIREIIDSGLRLGWIDASSPGVEIPDRDGGVGTARKIGMDAALALLDGRGPGGGVISCLDADTLVESNYLSAMGRHFSDTPDPAAVVKYAHQRPADPRFLPAICCYEIYLRSYVIGLSFAGSPYAFHSIGSTMACTAQAYVDVRGMNRRTAAEDFHFLNKLAKIGRIGTIEATTVFPSPRPSQRVPFGTGRRMVQFQAGGSDECRLYDPRTFTILREWLAGMEADPDRETETILAAARRIHPELKEYLDLSRFATAWPVIRQNCPDEDHLRRQFHIWFDGLKTLRLIHHLSRLAFPPVPMFEGLKGLLDRMGEAPPAIAAIRDEVPGPAVQFTILEELRSRFPRS
jgi:hypothetical protein